MACRNASAGIGPRESPAATRLHFPLEGSTPNKSPSEVPIQISPSVVISTDSGDMDAGRSRTISRAFPSRRFTEKRMACDAVVSRVEATPSSCPWAQFQASPLERISRPREPMILTSPLSQSTAPKSVSVESSERNVAKIVPFGQVASASMLTGGFIRTLDKICPEIASTSINCPLGNPAAAMR